MTTAQKAMRLFAVIVAGSKRFPQPKSDGSEALFLGETKLHALMFWLRNPDYLGWELLDLHEATRDDTFIVQVKAMLDHEEPILRRDAMAKWRFGAYEPLDDEMAILSSRGLVRTLTKPAGPRSAGNDFLLMSGSLKLAESLETNVAYRWYAERMKLVLRVAGNQGGSVLKDRQYKHMEYAKTRGHDLIAPITPRLVERIVELEKGLVDV